jgi:hypothetical protein
MFCDVDTKHQATVLLGQCLFQAVGQIPRLNHGVCRMGTVKISYTQISGPPDQTSLIDF